MICIRQKGFWACIIAAAYLILSSDLSASESIEIRNQLEGQRNIRSDLQQQKTVAEQRRDKRREDLARARSARINEENEVLAVTLGTIKAIESRMSELRREADGAIADVLKDGLGAFEEKSVSQQDIIDKRTEFIPETFNVRGDGGDPDTDARERPSIAEDTDSWRVQTSGDHEAILRAESPGINLAFINEQLRVYENALIEARAKHREAQERLHSSVRFSTMLESERVIEAQIAEDDRAISQLEHHISRADLRVEGLEERLSTALIQESLDSGKFDDTPHVDTAGGALDLDGLRWHEPESGRVTDLNLPSTVTTMTLFGDGVESSRRKDRETNMEFISHATELEQAARSGDQTHRDAARVRDAGGQDAAATLDESTRAAAEAQRKDSWGSVLGDAITEGVEQGAQAFGEALGSAAAERASRSLFERKSDRKKDAEPDPADETVAAAPPEAAAAPQVSSGASSKPSSEKQPESTAVTEDGSVEKEEGSGDADSVEVASGGASDSVETAQTETTASESAGTETRQPAATTQEPAPARRPRRTESSDAPMYHDATCPACTRTVRVRAGEGRACPYCVTMNCPRCGFSRTYNRGEEPSSCPRCE